ncbi:MULTISPECIES: TetR/AcrR family transcriptional regulator [unclassified Bradyrhizobium]|uniref:TetR/AcrR family transcriptional regulator n=1 Tax=unclassified Bradyrhizobium TaxID=2631580 RepID=UPI0028E2050E|nr:MULTISPECIES: TetR/AcrR family transcriptional regulator [unclassified Bradyrhizobium]
MRYAKDHKRQTHNRIVEHASYGLRQTGAQALSVPDLMKLAGLTHGGFYSHFDSRAALVAEAIAFAMDQTIERLKRLTNESVNQEPFGAVVADYLSPRHRDDPERGCALPALAADIGRSDPRARQAFSRKLDQMIDIMAKTLPEESPQDARQIATGAIAAMVGSILLSRAVDSAKASSKILDAGRKTVGSLGVRKPRSAKASVEPNGSLD